MTEQEQQAALSVELDGLINRYINEFEMTYASFVGVLTMKATEMTIWSADDCEE